MTMPLDFPALSNEEVTIFDVTTNYPASPREMKEYLGAYMNLPQTHIVVRKPGEPSEEYQEQMQVAEKSEYVNKLRDIEYKDAPKVKQEELAGNKYNENMLKSIETRKYEFAKAEK